MAAIVETVCIEHELAAIRLQEAELQAQQDAWLAERLAIAFSLGVNTEDKQAFENAILQLGLDAPGASDFSQLETQLAELRASAGHLLAEALQKSLCAQERSVRDSEAAAAALQAQERWHAQVAQHDAAFARRLATVDDETWEEVGGNLEEPLNLPMPVGAPGAPAGAAHEGAPPSGSFRATPILQPATTTGLKHTPSTPPPPPPPPPGSSGVPTSRAGTGPSGTGAGPSSHRATGPSRGTVECLSCFDRFPDDGVTCAGADAASSSTASAGCGHYFCKSCATEYIRGAVRERKFPIGCPMAAVGGRQQQQRQGGCRLKFSRGSVLAALQGHPKELQSYQLQEAQSSLDPGQLLYCPHKACSSPLLLDDDGELPHNQPATCPACGKGFCPHCRIPGWHQGYTCAAFQALPAHLRSAEDAAMLQLSERQQWKRCPSCKLVVERASGCNHIRCRCGSAFCYACGQPYKDTKPTPANEHGTPACGCPLFDVPAEVQQGAAAGGGAGGAAAAPAAAPVELQARYLALPQRPFRGGRLVSHTRCRYSASIYDCPQGPQKCWFWHDEDDDSSDNE